MRLSRANKAIGLVLLCSIATSLLFMNMSPRKEWLPPEGVNTFTVDLQGRTRKVLMYVPKGLSRTRKAPIVMALHGGGGNATRMRNEVTARQFETLADKRGFIVLYPEAILEPGTDGGHWNDGRNLDYESHRNKIDDVAFISLLLDIGVSDFNGLDMSRVYIAGASNGALMTSRIACRIGHRLAAVAGVVGSTATNILSECMNSSRIPILLMNGTDDTLMQWNSGYVHDLRGRPNLGARLSVPDNLNFWKKKNGCNSRPFLREFVNTNKADRSTVSSEEFTCADFTMVSMYTIHGGGHTWPGGLPGGNGATNQDINAAQEMMDFFNRFSSDRYQPTLRQNGISMWQDRAVGHGFPHRADFLMPDNRDSRTRAIIVLHGGGGQKHSFQHGLGLKAEDSPSYLVNELNTAFLRKNNVALIFVQGFSLPDKPGGYTWNNTIMTSQLDDKAMLVKLAADLRREGFGKVYLMGHSMGGVMVNRLWCESSTSFDGFGSSAGPMSPTLWNSCRPSVAKPYLHVTGLNDRILQLIEDPAVGKDINHLNDEFLTLDKTTRAAGGAAFVHPAPEFKNELVSYKERVRRFCGETASAPALSPAGLKWTQKTQENCKGALKMIQIRDDDHCTGGKDVAGGYKCDKPLNTWGTTEHLQRFVDFFAAN